MKQEHGTLVIEALSIRDDWPTMPEFNITQTKHSYYLDFFSGNGDSTLRFKISPDINPYDVARAIATGEVTPFKAFSLRDEVMQLQRIKSMPRRQRRRAMKLYKKEAKANAWALTARKALSVKKYLRQEEE